jgi:MFS family permease
MTCGLAVTRSLHVFAALSFIVGVVSVVPQVLIPLVADLAAPHRRAGAIGIIWGAVMLGIMLARLLSGVVAGTSALGERGVYWMAAGLQVGMILGAWAIVPDIPVKDTGVSYAQILVDMGKVVIHEPAVVQASLGAILNNM